MSVPRQMWMILHNQHARSHQKSSIVALLLKARRYHSHVTQKGPSLVRSRPTPSNFQRVQKKLRQSTNLNLSGMENFCIGARNFHFCTFSWHRIRMEMRAWCLELCTLQRVTWGVKNFEKFAYLHPSEQIIDCYATGTESSQKSWSEKWSPCVILRSHTEQHSQKCPWYGDWFSLLWQHSIEKCKCWGIWMSAGAKLTRDNEECRFPVWHMASSSPFHPRVTGPCCEHCFWFEK